jgi:hypothetical protein
MKKVYVLIASLLLLSGVVSAQIITHSNGEIEIPNVTSTAGPFGGGSLLYFSSSGSPNTAIQETWGLNLIGEAVRPVKIYNASLLVGYQGSGTNFGINNAYISGNVGIGTTGALDKLDISGTSGNPGRVVFGDGGNYTPYMKFYKWSGAGSSYLQTTIGNSLDGQGAISFQTGSGGAAIGSDAQTTRMIITQQGNVGVGTTTVPSGYLFAVNGSAIATSMTVKLQANWPDYVFKKDYILTPLSELKAYIDQNQHLPEIPSAEHIAKDGLNLGEMNRLLTKKVEELTLYLIEKDKTEKEQQSKLEALQNQINLLSQKLNSITEK